MELETTVFDLCLRYYKNLPQLARAMGISMAQVYRVQQGKRKINQTFIIGAIKAFPGYKLDDLFYVVPERRQRASISADKKNDLRRMIKEQRTMRGLMLRQLSELSGVSSSHLRRIERGERFPSAAILRKIIKPLGFSESELLSLADYLPPESSEAQRLP